MRSGHGWTAIVAAALLGAAGGGAQAEGPFNIDFPAGGDGVARPLTGWRGGGWSLYGWVLPVATPAGDTLIGGLGDRSAGAPFLALRDGHPAVVAGDVTLVAPGAAAAGGWRFLAASSDGVTLRFWVDGVAVGASPAPPVSASGLWLAPRHVAGAADFAGKIAGFSAEPHALSEAKVAELAAARPDPALIVFATGAPSWPVQVSAKAGLSAPQDAWTLPRSRAAFSAPVAAPIPEQAALTPREAADTWTVGHWSLMAATNTREGGAALSSPEAKGDVGYPATVPGTVLTTLVDRGVYPDPEHGLNNMAIPESLARQDYWYTTRFPTPAGLAGRHPRLTFNGVNYAAEAWLNGRRLGAMRGAFIRGRFEAPLEAGVGAVNALAVRVSPPPHPGIPHEQSLAAGAGDNGGMQALDGPTFIATEGWDWIPGVRDRNTGLWQDVVLDATGPVRLSDPQVVTRLPRADNSVAEVEIDAPVDNLEDHPVVVTVSAAFDDVRVARTLVAAPGRTLVKFDPADWPALRVAHPRLWWPNGYGAPDLHDLRLTAAVEGQESDRQALRFGMRQITYELSLMDSAGALRRVEIDPSQARALGQTITDTRHEAIRRSVDGWVASLAAGAEASPAVRALPPSPLSPYLVIKVNGVRIAARGGSWGMDDWRKRISRARLEPFFRLHREAHLNIIRNWLGQDTEPVFYDLADEYGLLVLNDFWESTQDFQLEAEDPALFLANAADVIARYRNHPSIALWFGRNEGVPQPILNAGLETLVHDLDGTRWYDPSSNRVNLHDSGPYDYREPEAYYTSLAQGFAVEVGTPSFPTLEAFEAMIPPADRWPISDDWAYHDWHQDGNGAVAPFMAAMRARLGEAVDLADFERKAQLMNYETHRAIFEGLNAGLWTRSSGRLLWMTQPAWPSTQWQILSHDYDTQASFYGVKSAAEPVHVQMNPPDFRLELVDTTRSPVIGARVRARVFALDGRLLADRRVTLDAPSDDMVLGDTLGVKALLATQGALVVALEARDAHGALLSRNVYWPTRDAAASRALASMPAQAVSMSATFTPGGAESTVTVVLRNQGPAPALGAKLTLLDDAGGRILPAYYSDNYVSLAPGEQRKVTIAFPARVGGARVSLRGWNVAPAQAEAVRTPRS